MECLRGLSLHLTLPGYWYAFISIPIAQFIVYRWYLRFVIWFMLLWRISRLKLRLIATHPDFAGGIGFLGVSTYAFAPVLFAQGALLSGVIASRILHERLSLMSFALNIGAVVAFFLIAVIAPLLVFTPKLAKAKLDGLSVYGMVSTTYVEEFDDRWVLGEGDDQAILGSPDIQSLADMGNSYAVVRKMKVVPFSRDDVVILVCSTVVPLLPLLLTIMPLEELLARLAKMIF